MIMDRKEEDEGGEEEPAHKRVKKEETGTEAVELGDNIQVHHAMHMFVMGCFVTCSVMYCVLKII